MKFLPVDLPVMHYPADVSGSCHTQYKEVNMRVVVALGGNALQKRGEPMTVENQRENVRSRLPSSEPSGDGHELVVSPEMALRSAF